MARATSSLPTPVSPVTSTGAAVAGRVDELPDREHGRARANEAARAGRLRQGPGHRPRERALSNGAAHCVGQDRKLEMAWSGIRKRRRAWRGWCSAVAERRHYDDGDVVVRAFAQRFEKVEPSPSFSRMSRRTQSSESSVRR